MTILCIEPGTDYPTDTSRPDSPVISEDREISKLGSVSTFGALPFFYDSTYPYSSQRNSVSQCSDVQETPDSIASRGRSDCALGDA